MNAHRRKQMIYGSLLIALPAFPLAAVPNDDGPPRQQPRIRVERLDMPMPQEEIEAPPTLKQEQQGTIFELWIPGSESDRLPSDPREPRLRNRRPPARN